MDLGTPLDADALRDALARHAADGLCDATTQLSPAEVTAMFPPALSDAILQSYVDTHPYSYDHVRHFELLVDRQLGAIFDEGGTVEVVSFENGVSHVVRLRNVSFQKPTTGPREGQPRGLKVAVGGGSSGLLYPTEATLCGLTYAVTICVDVEHYTYKLVRVPDAAAAPMPSNTPPAFSVLPTVYREVRRRLVWWDPAVGAPAALEKALDRDTAAYNATRIEAARADGTAATLARPSQLLADAVNGTDHVMVHALLAAWVAVRAAAEGAPCPHITPLPSPLVLPAAGGAGVAADVGSTLKAGADVAGVDVVGEDGEDGDDEDDEDAAASASDDEATAVAAKADVASRQHRYIQQLVGAPVLCRELPIAQLPCMLGCKYDNAMDLPPSERDTCILDHGGTFISRGTLKCIRSQKVQRPNVWVIEGTHRGPVTANVRSLHPEKFRSSSTLFLYLAPSATGASSITINVPFLPKYLPVVTVYRLLGFNVKDIVDLVFAGCDGSDADDAAMRRLFAANFSDPAVVQSMHELYEAVGGGIKKPGATPDKRRQQVHQQITAELLPHIGFDDLPLTRLKKALYLGLIIRDMLKVHLDKATADTCKNTRDFEGFNVVEMSAVILARMLRQHVHQYTLQLAQRIRKRIRSDRHLDVAALLVQMDCLTRGIMTAFSKGEVTVQKDASNAGSGVILAVQQGNTLALQTDLEHVSTALPRDNKYAARRGLDGTGKQVFGPAETPEGPAVGLLENPAVFARVRTGIESHAVTRQVLRLGQYAAESLTVEAVDDEGRPTTASREEQEQLRAWCCGGGFVRPFTSLASLRHSGDGDGDGTDGGDGDEEDEASRPRYGTLVCVNSNPVCVTDNAELFCRVARAARRDGVLPHDASIVRAPWGVLVSTDIGMMVFPLLHLPSLHKMPQAVAAAAERGTQLWDELVRARMIDWVDSWEALEYRVADTPQEVAAYLARADPNETPYTHMTLHAQSFMSTAESTIPFANHDQAPRITYQAGMGKQALSSLSFNIWRRLDFIMAHVLWYPQTPLCSTALARAKHLDDWPMGQNAMALITYHKGQTAEDSFAVNKAAIDRGMFTLYEVSNKRDTAKKLGATDMEVFEHPLYCGDDGAALKTEALRGCVNYDKIDVDGLPSVGTIVRDGDVIIGKTVTSVTELDAAGRPRMVRRDRSVVLTSPFDTEPHRVDMVAVMPNKEGHRMVRVRLVATRRLQDGDKLSARHGQKGTVGLVMREEDMPYVAAGPNEGMRPDIIVSVCSEIGRMTVGRLIEMLYGAAALVRGELVDATPFRDVDVRGTIDALVASGYGVNVTMMDGITGEPIAGEAMLMPCFMQRLVHMAIRKANARKSGLRAALTRQPMGGKADGGGQRVGEMEARTFLEHGTSFVADDAMRVRSDHYEVPVCLTCGFLVDGRTDTLAALVAAGAGGLQCRLCGSASAGVTVLSTTYCAALLEKELATMGIMPSLGFSKTKAPTPAAAAAALPAVPEEDGDGGADALDEAYEDKDEDDEKDAEARSAAALETRARVLAAARAKGVEEEVSMGMYDGDLFDDAESEGGVQEHVEEEEEEEEASEEEEESEEDDDEEDDEDVVEAFARLDTGGAKRRRIASDTEEDEPPKQAQAQAPARANALERMLGVFHGGAPSRGTAPVPSRGATPVPSRGATPVPSRGMASSLSDALGADDYD